MMGYKNYLEKQREKQYILDLTEISGGLPRKGFMNKLAFGVVLIMNGVSYDEAQARAKVHESRKLRKMVIENIR